MIVRRTKFVNSNNEPVELEGYPDHPLGQGGEGSVYSLKASANRVAKIYKVPSAQRTNKLKAMLQSPPDDCANYMAWPVDLLYEAKSNLVCAGFVMPKISQGMNGDYHEIFDLYNPGTRKQTFAQANYNFIVRAASNCATAFENTHSKGHLVGDVNQKNILVDQQMLIKLIDCDSFQIKGTSEIFRCPVGVGEFTAPEIHGIPFDQVQRNEHHDNFGLAVLIFQMLLMGRHPFSGCWLGKGADPSTPDLIKNKFFAYSKTAKLLVPAPNSLPRSFLPDDILELFDRAFETTARPSAGEWRKRLETFEKSLKKCKAVGDLHSYPQHLVSCQWCKQNCDNYFPEPQQTKPVVAQKPMVIKQKPFLSTILHKTTASHSPIPRAQQAAPDDSGGLGKIILCLILLLCGGAIVGGVFFQLQTGKNFNLNSILSFIPNSQMASPFGSKTPDAIINDILQAKKEGNETALKDALSHLEATAKPIAGDNIEANRLNKIGLKALKAKNYKAAVAAFGSASKVDPSDPKFLSNLGFSEMNAGALDSAEKHLHKSLSLGPQRDVAWDDLGLVLAKKGDEDKAVSSLLVGYQLSAEKTLKYFESLEKDNDPAVKSAGSAAISMVTSSTAPIPVLSPNNGGTSEGDSLSGNIALNSNGAALWTGATGEQVGLIHAILQASTGSELSFQRQLESTQKPPKGNGAEADNLNRAGLDALKTYNYTSAITFFEGASKADPSDPKSYGNLAFAEICSGKLDSAEKHMYDSIVLAPTRPVAWRTLGKILTKKGDHALAFASFLVGYHNAGDDLSFLRSLQNDDDLQVRHMALLALDKIGASQPGSANAAVVRQPGILPSSPNGSEPAVAAQDDVDFGPYMADLQRRIKRAWFPPRGQESRKIVVAFKVHSQGELSDLRIEKTSGVAIADQPALQAVQNAAPFLPLPLGAPAVVDIQFTFDYNVFSGGRSF